jgi:TrmH family RNA methyltransferase
VSELSKNKIKWIQSLRQKKHRDEEGLFILEGEKMVLEALEQRPDLIHTVVALSNYSHRLLGADTDIITATDDQLAQVSELHTPNKLLAVLNKPESGRFVEKGLRLVLCDVQDPGNLGTILRTADWFGLTEVICSRNTVDCFNEKALQSSMGSILRVNVHYTDLKSFLVNRTDTIFAADMVGENIYTASNLREGYLLMGNEGKGIPSDLDGFIHRRISIPKFGSAESLNVGVATGVILSEFARRMSGH